MVESSGIWDIFLLPHFVKIKTQEYSCSTELFCLLQTEDYIQNPNERMQYRLFKAMYNIQVFFLFFKKWYFPKLLWLSLLGFHLWQQNKTDHCLHECLNLVFPKTFNFTSSLFLWRAIAPCVKQCSIQSFKWIRIRETMLIYRYMLPVCLELLTGSWMNLHGLVGWKSLQKARWPLLS